MKKNFAAWLLIATVTICTYSCTKSNPSGVLPEAFDTILVKTYSLDTTRTSPNDTVNIQWFSYDGQGRISQFRELEKFNANDTNFYRTETFEYTGSSLQTFRVNKTIRQFFGGVAYNSGSPFFYVYDNSRRISDSSKVGGEGYNIKHYTYLNSNVMSNGKLVSAPGLVQDITQNFYNTVIDNKISETIDTLKAVNLSGGITTFSRTTSQIIYMANSNPYYRYSLATRTNFIGRDTGLINSINSPYLFSEFRNVKTSWSSLQPVPTTQTMNILYSFSLRADGYPLIAWRRKSENGLNTYRKTFFLYD